MTKNLVESAYGFQRRAASYKKPGASSPTVLVHGVDAELVKEATGKYYVDLLLDEAGFWKWRCESIGVVDSTQQDCFSVGAEDPVG
jgi:hypothetical protein